MTALTDRGNSSIIKPIKTVGKERVQNAESILHSLFACVIKNQRMSEERLGNKIC